MNPFEELANAIVLQAVTDYRKALKALRINPKNKDVLSDSTDCEAFFRSEWYSMLTSIDGETLLSKLRSEVA